MTPEDLKRIQDGFLEGAKAIVTERRHMAPIGFVVTLHKHVEKLFEAGWALEIIDKKSVVRAPDDSYAAVVVDLAMDYKRMYHAVLNVFPKTKGVLPQMLALGEMVKVDDPYKRVMRPFLNATKLHEKDVIAATMRHVCATASAFACITQSEAWIRTIDPDTEDAAAIVAAGDAKGLKQDAKSTEVIYSSMETREFIRMVTVPIHRRAEPGKEGAVGEDRSDSGEVTGFGDPLETVDSPTDEYALAGRMVGFLKPLSEAS